MAKIVGWEDRLYNALEEAKGRDFSWGEFDCASFACSVMEKLTGGYDFYEDFRGKYKTERGAYKAIKEYTGGGGLLEVAQKVMGEYEAEEVSPLFAQRGDLVLANVEVVGGKFRDALGICIGREVVFAGMKGLIRVPLGECKAAWRLD